MSDVEGDDAPAAAAAAPVVASSGPMGIDAAIQVILNNHIILTSSCRMKQKI